MKVSIITVVCNGAKTIGECIESVQSQGFDDIEHIIVDGASTDGTLDILRKHESKTTKIISEPDDGIYEAMNKGISHATGDIVGTLNADDYYHDDEVIRDVAKVFENKEVDACYGDLVYVDGEDTSKVVRRWKSAPFNKRLFYDGWMPPHPTFFVRRAAYEKYGAFNTTLGSAADYELMLRFLLKFGVSAEYIPMALVVMRTGGVSNRSLVNRLKANMNDRKAWKMNGLKPHRWTLLMKPFSKMSQFYGRDTE